MTDAQHRKSFAASRRSILKGLGAAAIGITLTGKTRRALADEEKKLNFYNWDTYIGETTLADFKTRDAVSTCNMSLFATNDELFAKLRAGNPGYDVIVPSNEFVTRMSQAQHAPAARSCQDPQHQEYLARVHQDAAFDPGRRYSMPYTWLVIGIGYRKSKVNGVPDSWKWLFDSDAYKGRIALVSDASDLVRNLRQVSRPLGQRQFAELIKQIEQMLIRQKPHIKAFHEDNGQDLLARRRSRPGDGI